MEKILEDLLRSLEESNSVYMLTGAILMQFYGEPRATGDIDVIVEEKSMPALGAKLKENSFIFSELVRGHNTLQHKESSLRIDLVIRESVGEEVTTIEVEGKRIRASTPENLILKKLEWMGDEYTWWDATDAVSIFVRMGNKLNIEYIFDESRKRGLFQKLRNLLAMHELDF
ncbi:MAG: hypothetical protein ACRD32_00700 [Nitrososphaerales archaeon]